MTSSDFLPRSIPVSVCDKTAMSEVSLEYHMPDYEPQVRRLLRVDVTVLPPASYVGSGNASFSGNLRFDILYCSPEGKLCMSHVSESYELSAPIDKDAEIDYSDEILAFCDLTPESLVSRVTAPRKLTVKCRLRAKIHAYGRHTPTEKISGNYEPSGIERLSGNAECASFVQSASGFFDLEEELEAPSGTLSVIGGQGVVSIGELSVTDGAVNCRGDLSLRILLDGENGPFPMEARLPFSEMVEHDDLRRGMSACAKGTLCELSITHEEGKLGIAATLVLSAQAQENVAVPFVRDLYSTARQVDTSYKTLRYPHAAVCRMANFTQSLYESLETLGIPSDAVMIDHSASSVVENVVCEREKWALVGETKLNLLLLSGGEYRTHELSLPFRYEFDAELGSPESLYSDVQLLGGRARIEGGKLSLECEMGISYRLCLTREDSMLDEAIFGEPISSSDDYIVCFPSEDDSLWEIAKHYHVPLSSLKPQEHFLVVKG